MPSFKEVATDFLQQNCKGNLNFDLAFKFIGDMSIEKLTSEMILDHLSHLYDNEKLRGAVLASYQKFIIDVCKFAFDSGYITEIPKIERRREPDPNLFYPPDSDVLELLLSQEDCTPVGTTLRLAWYCGLSRNEITFLKWQQVDLKIMQLVLPDRKVPLIYKMVIYLNHLHEQNAAYSEYVLISLRKSAPMAEQSVSALARRALDNYGQNNVRLSDLRSDYIIRSLEKSSWEYVSYISGVDLPALQQHYLPYLVGKDSFRDDDKPPITQYVRKELLRFLEKEKTGLIGLAIRFVWQMGIPISILPLLTWDIIDFNNATAHFIDRSINIPDEFLQILKQEKSAQNGDYKNIILNENKRKPTDSVFIQKAVQQSLIRQGISGITLTTLQNDYWKQNYSELKALTSSSQLAPVEIGNCDLYSTPRYISAELIIPAKDKLFQHLTVGSFADYNALKTALDLSDRELSLLLKECQRDGSIVRFGLRYFLSGRIVPRDKQKEIILSYVEKHQPVTSAQLTELLGLVERRQIFHVINPLLKSGELIRLRINQYCLPNYHDPA